ncbi:MAG TPA: hypothetical protein VGB08_07090, partial [Allosphingosinicella sp.]
LGALLLPGCGRGDVPLNNQQIAEAIENLAVEEVPEEKGPPPPALAEIGGPERERELPSGSGCEFSQGGRLLFVSAAGDALAKVNGFPVHFAASGPTGATGGYYITERFSLSIGRRADAAEAAETTAGWPARLVLTDRRQEENNVLRVDGAWRCGA